VRTSDVFWAAARSMAAVPIVKEARRLTPTSKWGKPSFAGPNPQGAAVAGKAQHGRHSRVT